MSKMIGWDVYKNIDRPGLWYGTGEYLTTVFFDADMDKTTVKRSLVDHDGYPASIRLRRTDRPTNHSVSTLMRVS